MMRMWQLRVAIWGWGPGCRFYVLDVAKMSAALGYKPCDIQRVATDPQFAMPLPNVSWYMPNVELVPPAPGYEDYYPFYSLSHQYQQNAGVATPLGNFHLSLCCLHPNLCLLTSTILLACHSPLENCSSVPGRSPYPFCPLPHLLLLTLGPPFS